MAEGNGQQKPAGIPEGDRFLVIRFSKDNEFSMMFSNLIDAQALHRMAEISLENTVRAGLEGPAGATAAGASAIAVPRINLPTLDNLRGRGRS
jgi:hypothetical protein